MIQESYFQIESEWYFMAHSELKSFRPTILFIHGLGDSCLSYYPYLNSDLAHHYNILIPDLIGYGRSSAAANVSPEGTEAMSNNYNYNHQIKGIEQQIDFLQRNTSIVFENFILIAHSMGAIHGTLLCESNLKNRVKGFINVEGSITQYGSFIAESMMNTLESGQDFSEWFDEFKQKIIYEKLAHQFSLVRPYYASLEFCHPNAFRQNAMQMYKMSRELPGKYTHIAGKQYMELSIPKIYCYGDTLSKETLNFLSENNLETKYFSCKNHFLLAECVDDFVKLINGFASTVKTAAAR